MAKVDLWGPYYFSQTGGFPVQTSFRVAWQLDPDWWSSTFTAAGIPTPSTVLSVAEPSIRTDFSGQRGVNLEFLATFNNIGSSPVDVAIVFLSRIGAT